MPACTDCTSVKVRHRQEKHCVRDNTLITSRFLRRRGFSFAGECTSVILLTAEVHITVQFSYESPLSAMTGSLKAEIRCVQVNRTPMLEFSIIIPRLQEKNSCFLLIWFSWDNTINVSHITRKKRFYLKKKKKTQNNVGKNNQRLAVYSFRPQVHTKINTQARL